MYRAARNFIALGAGLAASAVVGWLLLKESKRGRFAERFLIRSRMREATLETIPAIKLPLDTLEVEAATAAPSGTSGDDLTRIRDIGPRFAQALRDAGITSFAQLAQMTPESLAERLAPFVSVRPQRIRQNDWIGQARQLVNSSGGS
jgi:predicted flap endonuclease-1-like 5' DNA nuclease